MASRRHHESRILCALRNWFAIQYPKDFDGYLRIECGGKRPIAEATWLKREGQRPGTPDLLIDVPRGAFRNLWLEVKTEQGRPSALQKEFLSAAYKRGSATAVCYGFDECREIIKDYMDGEEQKPGCY